MELSVVIPTYNEKGNIVRLLDAINEVLINLDYEVVICDDSTDETIEILKQYINKYNKKNIKYFHRGNEKDLSTAVLEGFKIAAGKYIAVMDADMQHPPILLKYMLCAMKRGADMCIPSRFITGGNENLNAYRRFVSYVARKFANISIYNMKNLTDPTSGVFMIKREILDFEILRPKGFKILAEIVALSGKINYIIEVPYKFMERVEGKSKLNFKVTIQYIQQVFSLNKRQSKNHIKVDSWTLDELKNNMNE